MIDWLTDRAPRERALLALMLVLALPALVWLGILSPAIDRRADALRDWQDARALQAWVALQANEARQLRVATRSEARPPPLGLSGLEQGLIAADLRAAVTDLTQDDDGTISLGFDGVVFTDLGRWIGQASLSWGYDVSDLRISAGPEAGIVSARLSLTPAS